MTANRGIIYFNTGTKHLVRLVVSLFTLRQHYTGPVTILETGDEASVDPLCKIFADDRLYNIEVKRIPLSKHRRNSAYVTKSTLWRHSPYGVSLLLDADTVIVGDPTPLLGWADERPRIVVTRFGKWTTQQPIVANRIKQWTTNRCGPTNHAVPQLVKRALEFPHPAVNTGVVAWRRDSSILQPWAEVTRAGWRASFTDELAMQLLMQRYDHTLVGDRFNCSPRYGQAKPEEVRIWHCHGNKHATRPEWSRVWLPHFDRVIKGNVAGVKDWMPLGDKRLGVYLAGQAG